VPEGTAAGALRERHELCRGLHAEQNAIIQAAVHGISIKGGVFFITHRPCALCAKMICNAGISDVYYQGGYPDRLAMDIFREAGIRLICMGTIKEKDGMENHEDQGYHTAAPE
jgi:dCMP deaminase